MPSVPLPLPFSLLFLCGVGAASPWDTPQPALRVPEWTLKHRNYSALNFCSLLLRYARSSRVNKAALVFFLLLSLKNVFLLRTAGGSASPLSWEAAGFGARGTGWLRLLAPGNVLQGFGSCGLSVS